jgi:hypothetical protein
MPRPRSRSSGWSGLWSDWTVSKKRVNRDRSHGPRSLAALYNLGIWACFLAAHFKEQPVRSMDERGANGGIGDGVRG